MSYDIDGARHETLDLGDIEMSVYVAGEPSGRPAVVFSHGFPELAFSWRHQLPAVADAGFLALAPDQRGYGGTSQPDAIEDYDIVHLTGDLVRLLDAFDIEQAVFVGHDWGGFVVWQMPLLHRDRVAGVVGLNTPYIPRLPMKPTEAFRMAAGEDFYILRFQEPGVADRALGEHTAAVLDRMMRSGVPPEELRAATEQSGDFLSAVVDSPVVGEPIMPAEELQVFVDEFERTGFTGGLNWYRNFDRNWELTPQLDGARIDGLPCLMVTAGWDPVLRPELAQGMPALVDDLEMHELDRCGHWTQQERADDTNRLLVDFLIRRFREP